MNRFLTSIVALAVIGVTGMSVLADTTTYDAALTSPGGGGTPATNGVYYGSGNAGTNGAFTVVNTTSGIEIGLKAKLRQDGNPESVVGVGNTPGPGGVIYYVPSGPELSPSNVPNRAAWNYDFSIDLKNTGLTLNQISTNTLFTIQDLTTSTTTTYNPFNPLITDNSTFGPYPTGTASAHVNGVGVDYTTAYALQNSENFVFAGIGPPGYNMAAPDLYRITLDVRDNTNTLLGEDTIDVQVTPLPSVASSGVLMLGVVGIGLLVRNKMKRTQMA